ncbi:nudix hydrolase 17, mitochondrial-like isoform X2 [Andrographis paniculata]|uniref:nudix hydrolase 17, mitochondrial-like isoform X2 n=1 Tax=Andrographis paniculata TaxID=175694 RepID=UPI0021E72E73|nr:nudix hydrolase 17, mitochondrial-like isoform X2 [Andrographis paniculata]
MELMKMHHHHHVCVVAPVEAARTGRHLQRCIPYRFKNKINGRNGNIDEAAAAAARSEDELEILVISSKKTPQIMMFPKGGWESDESVEEAACRESLEEAGVVGNVEGELGRWVFRSKSRDDKYHEGLMFPLQVTHQLDLWPEKPLRSRQWMPVADARQACTAAGSYFWMREALDKLVHRLITHHPLT